MEMLINFLVRYLAVLVLAIGAVAGVGHASGFTNDGTDQTMFEGSQVFNITSTAATSYDIDSDGNVIVNVATNTNFDRVFFSSTGAEDTYQACQANSGQPGHNWICIISNSDVGAAQGIYLVATAQ